MTAAWLDALAGLVDVAICVKSDPLGYIQEAHIAVAHALGAFIEGAQGAEA